MSDQPSNRPPIKITGKNALIAYTWNVKQQMGEDSYTIFQGNRSTHGRALKGKIDQVERAAKSDLLETLNEEYLAEKGLLLTFKINAGYKRNLERFESISLGWELLNVSSFEEEGVKKLEATVFVKFGALERFKKKFDDYISNEDNKELVDPIEDIGLATVDSLWTSNLALPYEKEIAWWELWVRRGKTEKTRRDNVSSVLKQCELLNFEVEGKVLDLLEHTVVLVKTSREHLAKAIGILNCLAEIRKPVIAQTSTQVDLDSTGGGLPHEPLPTPLEGASSVCILDTGVNYSHPFLQPLCKPEFCTSFDAAWLSEDENGHGTEMCGIAGYGDMNHYDRDEAALIPTHWVESVKLLSITSPNTPKLYGFVTVECMSRAEIILRSNRVFSMAVTATNAPDFPDLAPDGLPTSWSAAIDGAIASILDVDGPKRNFVVSGGNAYMDSSADYPELNYRTSFEDPAQSWNAITVGAITHYGDLASACISEEGGLSPYSATSRLWGEEKNVDCPIKPEVVFEGGNKYEDPWKEDVNLRPRTLNFQFLTGDAFTTSHATSAATAGVARITTQIHSTFPNLWSETVRALLINSARWNSRMLEGVNQRNKGQMIDVSRTYGYGEPSFERATSCSNNRVTVFFEEEIQPYYKDSTIKTKEMMFFPLPLPKEELESLSEAPVKLYVTLSYFIEPSAGRRGLAKSKFRYANCKLRFDLKTPTESMDTFLGKRSKKVQDGLKKTEDKDLGSRGDAAKGWALGRDNQGRGSLHHDVWSGRASELAARDSIVIYPENGWWKLRPQHKSWDKKQRFSLVLTLETEASSIDLYSAVEAEVSELTVPQRVRDIQAMIQSEIVADLPEIEI